MVYTFLTCYLIALTCYLMYIYILSLFDVYIHIPHMLFDSFHMLFDVPSLSCICILHYLRILLKAKGLFG